jgi:hypothetical protein
MITTVLRLVSLFLGIISTQGFLLGLRNSPLFLLPLSSQSDGSPTSSRSTTTTLDNAAADTMEAATSEVKVGDKIPSVTMQQGLGNFEKKDVDIAELIAGKKGA